MICSRDDLFPPQPDECRQVVEEAGEFSVAHGVAAEARRPDRRGRPGGICGADGIRPGKSSGLSIHSRFQGPRAKGDARGHQAGAEGKVSRNVERVLRVNARMLNVVCPRAGRRRRTSKNSSPVGRTRRRARINQRAEHRASHSAGLAHRVGPPASQGAAETHQRIRAHRAPVGGVEPIAGSLRVFFRARGTYRWL